MSEQEQERERIQKEADVEGHAQTEPTDEEDAGLRREGDDPDVEGHLKR